MVTKQFFEKLDEQELLAWYLWLQLESVKVLGPNEFYIIVRQFDDKDKEQVRAELVAEFVTGEIDG